MLFFFVNKNVLKNVSFCCKNVTICLETEYFINKYDTYILKKLVFGSLFLVCVLKHKKKTTGEGGTVVTSQQPWVLSGEEWCQSVSPTCS